MKNKKLINFSVLGLLLLISIFSSNNQLASAKTTDSSVNLTGSLLNPGYLYISGQTMNNGKAKDFSIQTGDQPSYYIPYSYLGSSVYSSSYPSVYTPPNYNSQNSNNLQTLFGFQQSPIPADSKAYFLKYGNIVPTANEQDAITNPSSPDAISYPNYNNYISNYPFKDDNYVGTTTTVQSSLTLSPTSIERTINLDNWFKFDLNTTSSYSVALEASKGQYAFIAVQNYGSSSVSLYTDDQNTGFSDTLSNSDSSYSFFHVSNATNNLVQISLQSTVDSEVYIRVLKVDINAKTLEFDSTVEGSHEFKVSDYVYSADPFRTIKSIELHAYSFTVPTNMDGKLLSLKMTSRSYFSYSNNLFMYSELTNKIINTNSNFIGHGGEKINIFFTTVNFDAYYFSLKMVQSETKSFSLSDKLDISLNNNPVFTVNVPSDGIYEFYFEHGNQYNDYFYIYNSTGTMIKSFYGSGNAIVYLPADTYTISFNGGGLSQFMLSPKSETNNGSSTSISYRSGALYKFDSIQSGSYSFDLNTSINNLNSQVMLYIYSEKLQTTLLASPYSFYSQTTSGSFSTYGLGTIYFYIRPNTIHPTSNKTMPISLTFNGQSSSGPSSNAQIISSTYNQPGVYNLTSGISSTQAIQVNMNGLTAKTWNLLKIQTNNMNLLNTFTLHISDNIILTQSSLSYFPDYSTRKENNQYEIIFGFGALSSNVEFSLSVSLSNYASAGSVQFIIQKMNTVELKINNQQIGTVMPSANLDVNVDGFKPSGNTPGFEHYLAIFAIAIPVVIRKMKKK